MKALRNTLSVAYLRPEQVERLAKMSPWRCLFQPLFWRTHVDVLVLLVLFLLPLMPLAGWLSQSSAGTLVGRGQGAVTALAETPAFIAYLALLILPLLGWGVWLALHALAEVTVNHSIALAVRRNVDRILPRVRSGQLAAPELEGLLPGGGIVPPRVYEPAAPMIQLFENICQQAHEYRFDAGTTLVQPYQHQSLMGLAGLEGVQKLALRLGILGAFLGLLFAIRVIPAALNEMAALRPSIEQHAQSPRAGKPADPAAEAEVLRQLDQKQWDLFIGMGSHVFSALSVKFGSSIAGLYVAVGVSLFASALRRRLRLYFQQMEDTAIHFTLLASRAENKTSLRLDFERLREEMQRLRETVHDKSVDLLSQLKTVSTHLELQIQRIEDGMTRLGVAGQGLDGFLNGLAQKQSRFLDEVSKSYQAESLRSELRDIRSGLNGDQQALTRDVTERISKLSAELLELHRATAPRSTAFTPLPTARPSMGNGSGNGAAYAMMPVEDPGAVALQRPGFFARLKGWFART